MNLLTKERLHELLRYDPITGDFYWRVSVNGRAPIGAMAGKNSIAGPKSNGYRVINIDKRQYKAHRLVWFYFHGAWPEQAVDHINGNRLDNRIENLRDVSQQRNAWNLQRAKSNSKSGLLGVDWVVATKRWRAQIRVGGKKTTVGYFPTAEEASAAYIQAKQERYSG